MENSLSHIPSGMHLPEPAILDAMKSLVRQCEGGKVICRAWRGDAWLCTASNLDLREDGFSAELKPLRRVDTAMWRQNAPGNAFKVTSLWRHLSPRRHALISLRRSNWCITFDPQKVTEIEAMAEAPKMPVGDLLSLLRSLEIE
jgi:hypothetical protein